MDYEMTVEDLIGELEQFEPGAKVRLAFQPRWPFEHSIDRVVETDDQEYVYIGEGSQLNYLPGNVGYLLGWSERHEDEDEDE